MVSHLLNLNSLLADLRSHLPDSLLHLLNLKFFLFAFTLVLLNHSYLRLLVLSVNLLQFTVLALLLGFHLDLHRLKLVDFTIKLKVFLAQFLLPLLHDLKCSVQRFILPDALV